ncbi:MAG: hypothetical protein J6J18_02635 [Oscillospiraceae bacterium]|nr:hypothetical protein [Oscillospiraceae bacterium]
MAQKPDIQYIHQFYVPGSEAQVLELKPVKKKKKKFILPKPKSQKKILIRLDLASVCGIVVACMMMVLMTVGIFQLSDVRQEYCQMESYVISQQNKNVELEEQYSAGYDLADIREKALALGMIPIEEAETITIHVEVPESEPEPTWWEEFCWFFSELFA